MNKVIATALMLGLSSSLPTVAYPDHTGSTNTVLKNVPISFNEDDIGLIVSFIYDNCNASPFTTLVNGPHKRVSNMPGSNSINAGNTAGDWNLDFAVARLTGNGLKGPFTLSGADIADQVGFNPGVSLSVSPTISSNNVVTVTDTTTLNNPLAAQIVDAGNGQGGFDAVMIVKNGQPKQADIICDSNMYYLEGGGNNKTVTYGLQGYNFAQPVQTIYVFWQMAPSPITTAANIETVCDLLRTPAGLKEVEILGFGGDIFRDFGDPEPPANYVACTGPATICDESEPTPASDELGLSGNACNRNRGLSSPSEARTFGINTENATCRYKASGITYYYSC